MNLYWGLPCSSYSCISVLKAKAELVESTSSEDGRFVGKSQLLFL